MKTKREELIDFLEWFQDNYDWEENDVAVDNYFKYLKSINSASNESLSVTENEAKKEVVIYECIFCDSAFTYIEDLQAHIADNH